MTAFTDRRRFLAAFSALGMSSTLLPGTLWAMGQSQATLTPELIQAASELAGLKLSAEQITLMMDVLNMQLSAAEGVRSVPLPNAAPPAFLFDPVIPGVTTWDTQPRRITLSALQPLPEVGSRLESLAFTPVRQLAELLRTRKVSSLALTEMFLERLERLTKQLYCVITLTTQRALDQAREADREIARGRYRGPLHGMPWGAKDLLAVKGYPTTWGAGGFEQQTFDEDATVVRRLDAAGAVLVAKLSLGELTMGDVWFGGTTRNPWKPEQGSTGSSAGSASAVAAGGVPFALASETNGSISSPAARCGATGLRPTFGRVPRTGSMSFSWTLDKVGVMARTVEDTALVLSQIQGPDELDRTVRAVPFNWNARQSLKSIRVGFLQADFAQERPDKAFDDAALAALRSLGVKLVPVALPAIPPALMLPVMSTEAAASFDFLTRGGGDAKLVGQGPYDWPNVFRVAQLQSAVDYLNANRVRLLAMEGMTETFAQVDVIVAPTGDPQVLMTNLTGHPAIIVPNGFREDNTPTSITFLGRLYGEAKMMAVARAYQEATGFHRRHPEL